MRVTAMVLMIVLALSGASLAGEFFYSEYPNYWWYVDEKVGYEFLIPADTFTFMKLDWGGTTSLQIALGESGPLLLAGTVPGTDVNKLWNSVSAMWAATARSSRTTTDSTITTDQGLRARFKVLEGRSPGQPNGMVRVVVFTRDDQMTYLAFIGNERDYSGDVQQYWLRAVHSFAWRSE